MSNVFSLFARVHATYIDTQGHSRFPVKIYYLSVEDFCRRDRKTTNPRGKIPSCLLPGFPEKYHPPILLYETRAVLPGWKLKHFSPGIKFIHKQPKPYLSAFAPDRFRGNLSNGTRLHEVTNAYSNFPHQIVFIGCLLREYSGKCILYRDWNNVAWNVSRRTFPVLNLNTF
jgi:hypothetical protein